MGDSCCNKDSMGYITELITNELPGAFVHSVSIGDTEEDDRNAGFFGIVFDQIAQACTQIKNIALLRDGFNAVGFSQGGQFLRAYAETCADGPKIYNLVTYGSQHMGVADAPNCENKGDASCYLMRSILRNGAYLGWVQNRVVQAQYFKDPLNYELYLAKSLFLAHINNEIAASRNASYKEAIKTLNKLVLIKFGDEATVVPAESSWFGYYDDERKSIVEMENQALYIEDWIGIRWLNENGRLERITQDGGHMQIDEEFFKNEIIPKYLANAIITEEDESSLVKQ
ncbi:Palmitoyl-protein thioesterase 1 [Physocladia obscura]|uniref:Palmitoyl-protein thioesterase 1 n=1 Tax=Physocladia obscura TaxID=109957 RepID=A0AAD5XAJ1_9FUNG|nr:Palmitoyl-protein thioesterase 1 [Physocladia obscura]